MFYYDMTLNLTSVTNKSLREKLSFLNPNEDFKRKLLKGGGFILVSAIFLSLLNFLSAATTILGRACLKLT